MIGERASHVSEDEALQVRPRLHDRQRRLSARDLQFSDGQWVRAKSLDTFCPLGPKLVELDDPQNLKLPPASTAR